MGRHKVGGGADLETTRNGIGKVVLTEATLQTVGDVGIIGGGIRRNGTENWTRERKGAVLRHSPVRDTFSTEEARKQICRR